MGGQRQKAARAASPISSVADRLALQPAGQDVGIINAKCLRTENECLCLVWAGSVDALGAREEQNEKKEKKKIKDKRRKKKDNQELRAG